MSDSLVTKVNLLGFKEGIDYEVVSFLVIDKDLKFSTFERFFNKDINHVVNAKEDNGLALNVVKEKYKHNPKVLDIVPTKIPTDENFLAFEVDKIDFNNATDCGFGVIRILRGKHKNKCYLYNAVNSEENTSLMLEIYLILTLENYTNEVVKDIVNTDDGESLINILQITDDVILSDRLRISLESKNEKESITKDNIVKDNVIEFIQREER